MFGFKFYLNPANIYTIQDGVDGDILQVWLAVAGFNHAWTITNASAKG